MPESDDTTRGANADDWRLGTWEGNRRRQHQEFHALSFREKLMRIEEMAALGKMLAACMRRPDGAGLRKDANSHTTDRSG